MAYHIDELQPGMSASTSKTVTETDIVLFAGISTDVNPAHLELRDAATQEARQQKSEIGRHQQDCRQPEAFLTCCSCGSFPYQGIGQARFKAGICGTASHRLSEQPFEIGIKRHHLHFATTREQLLNNCPAQSRPHLGRKFIRVLGPRSMISDGFNNRYSCCSGQPDRCVRSTPRRCQIRQR